MPISIAQYEQLLQPVNPRRVQTLKKGNTKLSHLEAWDVRRQLLRIFGFFSYDIETVALDLVKEIEHPPGSIAKTVWKNGKPSNETTTNKTTLWTVVYRAQVKLVIKDGPGILASYEDGASGDAANQPSIGDAHDLAMKTALSQALKRCAVNLGDQFGLSLYDGGSVQPVVGTTLNQPGHGDPTVDQPMPLPDVDTVRPDPELATGQGDTVEDAGTLDDLPSGTKSMLTTHENVAAAEQSGTITTAQASAAYKLLRKEFGAELVTDLVDEQPPVKELTEMQRKKIFSLLKDKGISDTDRKEKVSELMGRPVGSLKELSAHNGETLISKLRSLDNVT